MSDNAQTSNKSSMDIASIIGLLLAVGAILGGQALEGGSIASIVQPTAAIIVLGGTFGACLLQFPLAVAIGSFKSIVKAFLEPKGNNRAVIQEIIRLANKARKEGVISLESDAQKITDSFLKKALTMAMDGVEPKVLRETMELEISNLEEEGEQPIKFWQSAGGYSPTIGILGAVLGLIHVMENLADPSKLGGGIAVAFVATVYGVGLANLVYLPISGKLKLKARSQLIAKEIMLVGVISILEGENPRLIDDKLKSYLSRKEQEEQPENKAAGQRKAA
ncbi:MAG TPA: flagellar motor protein [Acidobacteriota bacterium]|nr:flagellar motor protein [Acidobacteriota bacterium]